MNALGLRLVGAAAAVVLGATLLAGCASPRNALGPTESACYEAIPVGRAIVGREATFAGVRLFSLDRLEHALAAGPRPHLSLSVLHAPPASTECAVAFRGHFVATMDRNGRGPASGTWLLVIVSLSRDRRLATVVLQHPPFWLSRLLPTTR